MPLAGNVKLRNFLAAVVGVGLLGGIAVILGSCTLCSSLLPETPDAPEVPDFVPTADSPEALVPAEAAPAEASETPSPATGPGRPWDAVLLGWQGRDLGTAKIKDASKGTTWKINLYQDEGQASVNRAKVDIDRDDKWDEKWTFAPDGLSREVSPGDDEVYTETWGWSGSEWSAR